jgi:hypothetical protein
MGPSRVGWFPAPRHCRAIGAMLAHGPRGRNRPVAWVLDPVDQRERRVAASRASCSMAAQSPAATRSVGATHEPPTQATLGSAR